MTALLLAALLFPQIAMYSGVKPNGEPYLRSDKSHDYWTQLMTARYDVVILDASPASDYAPEILENLRWMNPDIKLLATTLGAHVHPRLHVAVWDAWKDTTGKFYPEMFNAIEALDGYLYTRSGRRGLVYTNVNLSDTVVAKTMADIWLKHIVRPGLPWDGLFLDVWCISAQWEESADDPVDYRRHGYATGAEFWAAYAAGHRWQAEYLRRHVPEGFLLVGNCGSRGEPSFDGWMRENWPKQNGGTWESNMLGFGGAPGYLTRGTHNWLTMPFDPWPTPMADDRWARWGLGSATLGDGVFAAVGTAWDPYRGFSPWWLDEFSVDACGRASGSPNDKHWLGSALGPAYQLGAIWRRDFDHGAVIVNPTTQTQQVPIRGLYRFILGAAAPNTGQRVPSTLAVAPASAIFLVRGW